MCPRKRRCRLDSRPPRPKPNAQPPIIMSPIPREWWRALHDRELDSLIDRAIAASPTLEVALNRLQEARAQEFAIIGSALPMLGASEGGGIGSGSDLGRGRATQTLVSAENGTGMSQITNLVGFDAAWEIDVFGKFRRAIEAAQYDVEAAIAARNVVLISLVADVTRAYLDLRALQMELAVLRKNITVAQKYVDFVQERFNRGITNELDVTLAQRELARLQAQVAPLISQINAGRYVIAVLIGEFPENLGRELTRPGLFPALPGRIRPGLPIDLLRHRPDIAEAERQLASANALIGVVTADLFPQVAVTAAAGNQQGLGGIPINPIWAVGPAVAAPLLDFVGSMPTSKRPTFALGRCCSITSKQYSTPFARWTARLTPMRRSRIGCVTWPML